MTPPDTASELLWVSESKDLPRIGQTVLLATPRQDGEFWDIATATLLARHENVIPLPVQPGQGFWPTDYYWSRGSHNRDTCLVTGNGWWASLANIALPPMAEHGSHNGYDFVRQVGRAFISKDPTP
jgi:hypothetical protein